MPRKRNVFPSYLHHKPSGQARVRIRLAGGSYQNVYLGPYDSEESRKAYQDALARHVPGEPLILKPAVAPTVGEIVARFMNHAETHYRRPDGTPTGETVNYRVSVRPLLYLFGELPAVNFGPKALKKVRAVMLAGYDHPEHGEQPALARKVINQRIGRIVRVMKCGVEEELVPETVHRALATVRGLQAGRSEARETQPVCPVEWADVEKTLARLNPVVRAMVLIEWFTGMRPGEVTARPATGKDKDTIDRNPEESARNWLTTGSSPRCNILAAR